MLVRIFETVLKMNMAALCTASVVLLIKYALQKIGCPRKTLFWLWAVIAFRLVCPVSVATPWSAFNLTDPLATAVRSTDWRSPGRRPDAETALAAVWLTGALAMTSAGLASQASLRRRLRYAVRLDDRVWLCDGIPSPFVLGVFRAAVYLPARTKQEDAPYILLHERTHLERFDPLTKEIGYLLLSVHWFNPANWLLFRLFSDDMEMACDETALSRVGLQSRKAYGNALLDVAASRDRATFYRVGFAANVTKRRVKNMIRFQRKSKIWGAVAAASCVALALTFGTDALPTRPADPLAQTDGAPDEYALAADADGATGTLTVYPGTGFTAREDADDRIIIERENGGA